MFAEQKEERCYKCLILFVRLLSLACYLWRVICSSFSRIFFLSHIAMTIKTKFHSWEDLRVTFHFNLSTFCQLSFSFELMWTFEYFLITFYQHCFREPFNLLHMALNFLFNFKLETSWNFHKILWNFNREICECEFESYLKFQLVSQLSELYWRNNFKSKLFHENFTTNNVKR